MDLPFVLKFAWGGEGETVFLIRIDDEFEMIMDRVETFELSCSTGFLIQEYIPTYRSLRVVIIGERSIAYCAAAAAIPPAIRSTTTLITMIFVFVISHPT